MVIRRGEGTKKGLIEKREKYNSYRRAFIIARLVLDAVKVLSKERLLVICKGGSAVEQTIEY